MKKWICLLIMNILIIGSTGWLNAASLDVTSTDVILDGADGIKKPNGDYVTIPPGSIIMWSGSIAEIPAGWILCDGANGTPDLTDRFVIHADADSGGTNNVGQTGGSEVHSPSPRIL